MGGDVVNRDVRISGVGCWASCSGNEALDESVHSVLHLGECSNLVSDCVEAFLELGEFFGGHGRGFVGVLEIVIVGSGDVVGFGLECLFCVTDG